MSDTADAVLIASAHDRIRVHGRVSAVEISRLHGSEPAVVFRALCTDPTLRQDPVTREWLEVTP